jgi:hypothetical protein
MRENPIRRLRAANPIPEPVSPPSFDRLRSRMIRDDDVGVRAVVPAGRDGSGRRLVRMVPVAGAVLVTVVVAVGAIALIGDHRSGPPSPGGLTFLSAGMPPVPSLGPSNESALTYLAKAYNTVDAHHKTCQRPVGGGRVLSGAAHGTPSPEVLDDLGVLRLPRRDAPILPPRSFSFGRAFVSYARIARQTNEATFVVVPIKEAPSQSAAGAARCDHLVSSALKTELAQTSPQLQRQTMRIADQLAADNRYVAMHRDAGVCVADGHSGVSCGPLLSVLADGLLQGGTSNPHGSTWSYLVPDGVASVVAHYPARRATAGGQQQLPARTATAKVVNNLAVWRTPSRTGAPSPDSLQWKSASGHTIRVVHR